MGKYGLHKGGYSEIIILAGRLPSVYADRDRHAVLMSADVPRDVRKDEGRWQ